MGNCIRKESAMQWGGEDWGSPASETCFSGDTTTREKAVKIEEETERLLLPKQAAAVVPITEVKIKITKKQLEELLGRMDVKGLSVEQVVAHLMSASDQFETHQRSWRPALQSIPEVD